MAKNKPATKAPDPLMEILGINSQSPYLKDFKTTTEANAWAAKKGYSFTPDPKAGLSMIGQVQVYEPYSPSDQKGMSARQVTRNVYGAVGGGAPGGAPGQGQAGSGAGGAGNAMKAWGKSIDAGVQQMIDPITKMINDNQANINLFMGTVGDLVKQMNSARPQQQSSPYAVTTTAEANAPTAQTTKAISRRPRPAANPLTIGPTDMQPAGSGLNIAV